ncbi:MAG: hypothetical protein ABI036_05455 [Fibrobacteria bacterium]
MQFKSLSKLAMVAALSFGASAFAAADAAAPVSTGAKASASTPVAKTAAAEAAKSHSFSGTVVSSDAIANTIVVKNAKAEETFTVAPTVKIAQGKKDLKIADVMKDEKVMIKYSEENGVKTASSIRVSAAAAKKEAKSAATAAAK